MIRATSCGIGRSSRDACRRTAAWPLLAALAVTLAASAAPAAIEPNDDTPAGTAAAIELALSTLATLPPTNPARPALDRARADCAAAAPSGNGCALAADRCSAALAALYDALGTDARDALGRKLFRTVRRRVGDALSRLAWTRAGDTADGCAALSPRGPHAARIEIGADDRSVAVRPLRPLRAGRRYRLLLQGLPPDVSVRWWTEPSAVAEIEADLVAAYEATFPERADRFAEAEVRLLLKRIAEDGLGQPGIPGSVGIRGRLSRPLDGTEIARLRAAFASTRGTPPVAPGPEFRTADPRAALATYREAFAARACSGPAAGVLLRAVEPRIGTTVLMTPP
ncbi:MAG: hypothetical protein FJ148_28500, partial [Deltaproteobacteria bacterium]|nr:hypothetical protein [Deltaproteobacteria bacterium]